jgi:hypothetical protein
MVRVWGKSASVYKVRRLGCAVASGKPPNIFALLGYLNEPKVGSHQSSQITKNAGNSLLLCDVSSLNLYSNTL